jgi:diguanylate cyclase (GGDEF)-like protein
MGIRLRLLLIITVGLSASFALSLGLLLRIERRAGEEAAVTRAAALLSTLAVPVSLLLTQGRVPDLDNIIGVLDREKVRLDLDTIVLVDAKGTVLATSDEGLYGTRLDDPLYKRAATSFSIEIERDTDEFPLRVAVPVATGIRWGTLIGTISKESVAARARETGARIIVTALVVSAVGLFILLLILSIFVVKPVRDLSKVAQALADGDLTARAPVRGHDEISLLGRVLNDGAARLERTTAELETAVRQRTEELSRTNDELVAANARLEHLATTDGLTRLYNHRHFHTIVKAEIDRQRRAKGSFGIVMMDVDHFKHFNDTHGHPAGDTLLRDLASVLRENTRSTDFVGRYGGEEFAVLLLDVDLENALARAEKLRALISAYPFENGATQPLGRLSVSMGVAIFPDDGNSMALVMEAADRALYEAKRRGRDRVCSARDIVDGEST